MSIIANFDTYLTFIFTGTKPPLSHIRIQSVKGSLNYDKNMSTLDKIIHNYHIVAQNQSVFYMYPSPVITMHCTKYEKNCSMAFCTMILAQRQNLFYVCKALWYLTSVPSLRKICAGISDKSLWLKGQTDTYPSPPPTHRQNLVHSSQPALASLIMCQLGQMESTSGFQFPWILNELRKDGKTFFIPQFYPIYYKLVRWNG